MKTLIKLIAIAAAWSAQARLGAAAPEAPEVELREEGALYQVEGRFTVEAELSSVWSVLTDYGRLKGIVKSLKKSVVLERRGSSALVEQVAEGRFLFFTRSIPLRLKIEESPLVSIRFEEVSGAVFPHYRGSWTLAPSPAGVQVTYRLGISRNAVAPSFLERGLFKAQSGDLMRELRDEILCRGRSEAAAPLPLEVASSAVRPALP